MPNNVFHFFEFRLDAARRELTQNGELVDLSSRAFDCLVYLVQHRERAVGRDELISAVWGRADVSDNMLSQTLLRVRRALGEGAADQSAIRTVTKFGYRWVAPTSLEPRGSEQAATPAAAAAAETTSLAPATPDAASVSVETARAADEAPMQSVTIEPAAPAPPAGESGAARRQRWFALAAALLIVLVVLGLAWRGTRQNPERAGTNSADVQLLALVLPVEVHADASWEWLRFGLMDLVATRLREGGVHTLDSQNLYILLGNNPEVGQARPNAELGLPAVSRQRIYVRATLNDQHWQVDLVSIEGDKRTEASASGNDVTACARLATDRMLLALGHSPASFAATSSSVQELLERSKVALLTDHPEQALDLIARAPGDMREDLNVQVRQVQIEMRLGRTDDVRAHVQALLPRLDANAFGLLRARALNAFAATDVLGEHAREATPLLDEAMQLAERFHSAEDAARTLELRGIQQIELGASDAALASFGKARLLYDSAGDPLHVAGVDMRAGSAAQDLARFDEAVTYYTRAEAAYRMLGASDWLAFTQAAHVMAKLAQLDAAGALELSNAYWPPEAHAKNDRTLYFLIRSRAAALAQSGRLREAETLLDRIRDEARGEMNERVRQNAALDSAAVALRRGAFDAAIERARPLAGIAATDTQSTQVRVAAWHMLIAALRRRGDEAGASAETTRFDNWAAALAQIKPAPASDSALRDARFYAELDRADEETAAGKVAAALPRYATLLAQAHELHVPERTVQVAASYVPALLIAGQVDQASAVAGNIGLWVDTDMDAAWTQAQVYRALGQTAAYHNALQRVRALAGESALPPGANGS